MSFWGREASALPTLGWTTHLRPSSTFSEQCVIELPSLHPQDPFSPGLLHLKAIENHEYLTLENIPYFTVLEKGEKELIFSFGC